MAYRLRQEIKRRRRCKPHDRDWRVNPRPLDTIAILNRAYYYKRDRSDKRMTVPIFRDVVRVTKDREFYRRNDDGPLRSRSRSTWRRPNADLVGRAIEAGEKIGE